MLWRSFVALWLTTFPLRADLAVHADDAPPPPLNAISGILSIDGSDESVFGKSVRVRGVVTWCGKDALFVQDASAAIWIDIRNAQRNGLWPGPASVPEQVVPGIVAEIRGVTNRAGYSPAIYPEVIDVVGQEPVPPATPFDPDLFFTGFQDGKRIAADVIVQAVRDVDQRWRFIVDHVGRRFAVDVEKARFGDEPENLVDARVRIEGVALALFNPRGEFVWPKLAAYQRTDFTVLEPPPTAPFEAPMVALHRLGSYRAKRPQGHRLRTEGIVIHSVPGQFFYLQDAAIGVRVDTTATDALVAGDRVEVAGFLHRTEPAAMLTEAIYRKIGSQTPPAPLAVDAESIIDDINKRIRIGVIARPGDYEGCLVTFPARVLWMNPAADGGLVVLSAGKSSLNAWASPGVFAAIDRIQPGTEVQVTGVASIERANDPDVRRLFERPLLESLRILLRTPADLVVVKTPSWWTPTRLWLALGGVAAVTTAMTGWVISLRRQVRRQLAVIQDQLQADAATDERQRIAREFHDTLEQDLAGVAMRLDVAAERAGDEGSRAMLESQRSLLERLRSDTHDFLWDLRDPSRHDGSLRESLEAQTEYMRSLTTATIGFQATDPVPVVSPFIQHHVLRIVREAVNNAVRHGTANQIDIRLNAERGRLGIEVSDNGCGFDVDERGHIPGHFGIRGMRERARRINADISVRSHPTTGTTVSVSLPLPPRGGGI